MAEDVCPFCASLSQRTFLESALTLALWDAHPVSPGHALIIPRRHIADWFSALLRPLIQREWTALVARFNGFPEAALEAFLFGCPRTPTATLRSGLREIQNNRCFYCDKPIVVPEIDHFVPWARFADDGLDNLVLTDRACNSSKSAHLAASDHVERWNPRFVPGSSLDADLANLAQRVSWERDTPRTRSVARGIYLRLPQGSRLWLRGEHFETVEPQRIVRALGEAASTA